MYMSLIPTNNKTPCIKTIGHIVSVWDWVNMINMINALGFEKCFDKNIQQTQDNIPLPAINLL